MVLVFLVFKDEQERQFMREKGRAAVETTKKLSRTWLQSCCAWMSCWFTTWMSLRVRHDQLLCKTENWGTWKGFYR